jgi:serine/threonine-protein kinase
VPRSAAEGNGILGAVLERGSELGGYRIERELGRGGMGVVYEAVQIRLGRTVALKVLAPELGHDAEFQERFRREGLAQAAVEHPHIIPVYEANEADSLLFLAMRLVRGPTLKELIRSSELARERALPLLAQVADALDAAHRAGLVHRDVKPQNVLVDSGDHAYLADFGLTKAMAESGLTRTGQYLGTPHYIAPEQVSGEPVGPATDVYALAAVAYECLTGNVPFERDTNQAVLFAHVYDRPPRASEARPGLPPAVDAALERGMAKEPGARQPSAGALVAELVAALEGEAIAPSGAPAPTPGARPTRPARRPSSGAPDLRNVPRRLPRPPLLAGGAVVLLGAVLGALLLLGGGGGDRAGSPPARSLQGPQPSGISPARGTVTLGSDLRTPPSKEHWYCSGSSADTPCTFALSRLPEPDRPVEAPFDGVVTRWQVEGAAGPIRVVVLRGELRPGGVSSVKRVAGSAEREVRSDRRQRFRTHLKIRRGDAVGLQLSIGAYGNAPYSQGAWLELWAPPLGAERRPSEKGAAHDYELLYNAVIERDRDGDGFGDVTEDHCPTDAHRHEGC